MKKPPMNHTKGTGEGSMEPHEREYKELLTESVVIYRGALDKGETHEAALEKTRQHLQNH